LKASYYLLLLCAQKKEQEKSTLFHGPSGYLVLLAVVGTLKNSRSLCPLEGCLRQFQRLFPPTAVMLSVKEWVLKKDFVIQPIITLPSFEKMDENSAATCLSCRR